MSEVFGVKFVGKSGTEVDVSFRREDIKGPLRFEVNLKAKKVNLFTRNPEEGWVLLVGTDDLDWKRTASKERFEDFRQQVQYSLREAS